MKKLNFTQLLFSLFLLTSYVAKAQTNPDFFLGANGITCFCPDTDFADVGDLVIDGELNTFTKRTRAELDAIINNNVNDPQIPLTCASGIVHMPNLFNDQSNFNQNIENWDVSQVTDMS